MSTLHHQPPWLSLRNTNQQSAPALSLSLPPLLLLVHSLSLSLFHSLTHVDRKQVLHHHFNSGVGVQVLSVFFFSYLLETHGVSSGEGAQSKGSGV